MFQNNAFGSKPAFGATSGGFNTFGTTPAVPAFSLGASSFATQPGANPAPFGGTTTSTFGAFGGTGQTQFGGSTGGQFGGQQPAFGATTGTFGSQPGAFGAPQGFGTGFGQTGASTFGQPASTFGQTGGSTFGQTAATGFGQASTFGQSGTSFGQPAATGFGAAAKPFGSGSAGFGTTGFGGAAQAPSFGTQAFSSGFQPGASSSFGMGAAPAQASQGTRATPFSSSEVLLFLFSLIIQFELDSKNQKQFFQTITAMPAYNGFSLEELRCIDLGVYVAPAKSTAGGAINNFQNSSTPAFGFGQTQPQAAFGASPGVFGTFASSSQSGFGASFGAKPAATPSFGTTTFGTTSAPTPFSFASVAQPQTKSTSLFGSTATTATTGFGSTTSGGLFGQTQAKPTGGIFGATAPSSSFQFSGPTSASTTATSFSFGQTTPAPVMNFGGGGGFGSAAKPSFGTGSTGFNFGTGGTNAFASSATKPFTPGGLFNTPQAAAGNSTLPPGMVIVSQCQAKIDDADPYRMPDITKPTASTTHVPSIVTQSPFSRLATVAPSWKSSAPPKSWVQAKPRHYHLTENKSNAASPAKKLVLLGDTSGETSLVETDRILAAMRSSRSLENVEVKEIEVAPLADYPCIRSDSLLVCDPPFEKLLTMSNNQLKNIRDFRVIHPCGELYWPSSVDLTGVDLDRAISFEPRTVDVYPPEIFYSAESEGENSSLLIKPAVGEKLNTRCKVTLKDCWPLNKATKERVKTTDEELLERYRKYAYICVYNLFLSNLISTCDKQGLTYISYNTENGEWKFEVEHF